MLAWQRTMHGEERLLIDVIKSLCSFCSEIQKKNLMTPNCKERGSWIGGTGQDVMQKSCKHVIAGTHNHTM